VFAAAIGRDHRFEQMDQRVGDAVVERTLPGGGDSTRRNEIGREMPNEATVA
jgi:hypothetical protein